VRVVVDDTSPVPAYEQVREQIARLVRSGVLPVGAQLPSIRQLAADLRLAAGTVARAYAELEREGLVGGRGRQGTRVRAPAPRDADELAGELAEHARAYVRAAAHLAASPPQALAAVEAALAESGLVESGLHDGDVDRPSADRGHLPR
jgi:DNA-binding transcriptional regulator YhcF (GntR family)